MNEEETSRAPEGGAGAGALPKPWARLRRVQPEARLALAVLESAIDTLRATYGVEHRRARTLAAETWHWVASDDARQPFAFRWICQHLEIDAAWLRAGLARWRPRESVVGSSFVGASRRRCSVWGAKLEGSSRYSVA